MRINENVKWWENKCFWNFSFDLRRWEKTWKAFFNYLKWKLTTSTRMSPFKDDPFKVIWRIKYSNLLSHLSPHIIVFDGNSPSTKVVNIKNELGQFLKQLILRMTTFVHKGGFINITCHLFSYPFRSSEQEAYIKCAAGEPKRFSKLFKRICSPRDQSSEGLMDQYHFRQTLYYPTHKF